MTGEAFSLESLVLPSGVKALCEDQALRSSRATWRPGSWEATPIAGSRSPAPLRTASSAPVKVPGSPDPEVRLPPGKGKRRHRCRSTGTGTMRVLPQLKGAVKPRGRRPHRAAKPKGASPGGSSVATAP
jgi:hypothetical protein